jgi:hypothetical protein
MKDNLITCPMTKEPLCYVTEVAPGINNYMSLASGYFTNSLMIEGEDFYNEQIELLPELYKQLAWKDPETEMIWLPQSINLPSSGMVFINGTSTEDWEWVGVLATKVGEDEKEKYPIPGKKGEFYEYKMDMKTMKKFGKGGFIDSLDYIGVMPRGVEN